LTSSRGHGGRGALTPTPCARSTGAPEPGGSARTRPRIPCSACTGTRSTVPRDHRGYAAGHATGPVARGVVWLAVGQPARGHAARDHRGRMPRRPPRRRTRAARRPEVDGPHLLPGPSAVGARSDQVAARRDRPQAVACVPAMLAGPVFPVISSISVVPAASLNKHGSRRDPAARRC
jgi:hypothetical protein